MRMTINLATEPFQKVRPLIARTVFLGTLLSVSLGWLVWMGHTERGKASQIRAEIAELRGRLARLTRERAELEQALKRPENAAVLDQVAFLNSLLYRKGISWTRIFADLEGVMPYNVRLVSVRPQVDSENEVYLDMVVASQSQVPVIEMLRRMENSPLFSSVEIHSFLPPSQEQPLYRYRVSVSYGRKL